jgi:hypothetical protein
MSMAAPPNIIPQTPGAISIREIPVRLSPNLERSISAWKQYDIVLIPSQI